MYIQTEYSFFQKNFDDTLICNSNLYSTQRHVSKPTDLTFGNIKHFLDIFIYMSLVHVPNIRSYWTTNLGDSADVSRSEFERIQKFIHFADKLYKFVMIIDTLKNKVQCVKNICQSTNNCVLLRRRNT